MKQHVKISIYTILFCIHFIFSGCDFLHAGDTKNQSNESQSSLKIPKGETINPKMTKTKIAWKKIANNLSFVALVVTAAYIVKKKINTLISFKEMKNKITKEYKMADLHQLFNLWKKELTHTEPNKPFEKFIPDTVSLKDTAFVENDSALDSQFFKLLKKHPQNVLLLRRIREDQFLDYTESRIRAQQWYFEKDLQADAFLIGGKIFFCLPVYKQDGTYLYHVPHPLVYIYQYVQKHAITKVEEEK